MASMHPDHDTFISAIGDRTKVVLTFVSKEDAGLRLVRTCAPMDYGPSRRANDQSDRYHFWDYDSDSPGGRHTLGLLPGQVVSIEGSNQSFDPAEFVTWSPPYNWFWPRDWGEFS
jgi:hypothetical protein